VPVIAKAIPGPHQLGARLDPSGQLKPAIGLGPSRFHQLIQQPPALARKTAIGPLLNSMRDAAPKQVRAERLWRFGSEQLPITTAQLRDWHFG